jgi:hypothetical protein
MKLIFLVIFSLLINGYGLLAQTQVISGTVTSSVEGEGAVTGASVVARGTTLGTITNADGKYSLSVPQNVTNLVFSYIGMKKLEVEITGRTVIDVVMEPDVLGLDEVVVTALGISRKRKALGYAVQDLENDVIERAGNSDLAGALQGKLAGIDIKPSSGMPGASSQIVIRGA